MDDDDVARSWADGLSATFGQKYKPEGLRQEVETETKEWPQKLYTLFTHQYLWNKFK